MARLPRLCIPGWPHVLVQRGHNSQAVFVDDTDRQLFQGLLAEAAPRCGVQVHAYALMDDEVRLVATPTSEDGLSQLVQSIGRRYVATFNRRHGRRGGLWEGRFRSTVVDPEQHLLSAMRFVELGPAGAPVGALPMPWSSAAHHLGIKPDPFITEPAQFWALGNTPFEREAAYRRLLEQGLTEGQAKAIQTAIATGWPLGGSALIAKLEATTSRRLTPLPRGRPRAKAL